ncbi:hypothetical protein AGR7B_pAt0334 [Agrobacterium deltaense RV3]|nr:hypothetical protein AGR7B_pAt0334 [Agrobacterium deltaense RV3]
MRNLNYSESANWLDFNPAVFDGQLRKPQYLKVFWQTLRAGGQPTKNTEMLMRLPEVTTCGTSRPRQRNHALARRW